MPAYVETSRVSPGLLPPLYEALAAVGAATAPSSLVTWYLGLIPHWTGAMPRLKSRLLLRAHQWIVDRVLAPDVELATAAADLRPGGALSRVLADLVPAGELDDWRQFITVLVANLRHALLVPVARRNEAWVRWMFLIPYSVRPTCGAAAERDGGLLGARHA